MSVMREPLDWFGLSVGSVLRSMLGPVALVLGKSETTDTLRTRYVEVRLLITYEGSTKVQTTHYYSNESTYWRLV